MNKSLGNSMLYSLVDILHTCHPHTSHPKGTQLHHDGQALSILIHQVIPMVMIYLPAREVPFVDIGGLGHEQRRPLSENVCCGRLLTIC